MTYGPTDRAVKLRHLLTPEDVELIVDALEVDDIYLTDDHCRDVSAARVKAALCGGTEEDYR